MDRTEEFAAFVRAHAPALVRLGWALTGDRQRGEDLAQTIFDRLWARWDRVSAAGDPWPYVQRIAVSQASTWRRRRWLRDEVPSSQPPERGGEDGSAAAEDRVVIERWLRALPPRQRAVVTLLPARPVRRGRRSPVAVLAGDGHDSPSPPSTGTSTAASLQVSGDRLTAPISYGDGVLRFSPLPADYQPAISRDDALAIIRKSAPLDQGTPVVFLASLTSYSRSTSVRSGLLVPDLDSVPAWVMVVEDVSVVPNGAGNVSGVPRPSESVTPLPSENDIAMIDARDGSILEGPITADADTTASTAPVPIDPQPKNTSASA